MAETSEIVLNDEETQFVQMSRQLLLDGADIRFIYGMLVAAAIPEHCTCSKARFDPERLGSSFSRGRIEKIETVQSIAGRYALCTGFANGECHFPNAQEGQNQ